ncbi:hypothetical protein [Microbulbifer sp. SAOS-129_SWC]|uniref:hypothetical protein n=1 Tax=Microbulbifer sp. SAOS-129_SWC TaxID=3145235 RepID=UPI003217A0C9
MTIYKIFADAINFQSFSYDNEDFLDILDPHVGELQAMRLGMVDTPVANFWEPLELSFFQNEGTVDLPDIGICGPSLLGMNQKAYDAVAPLIGPLGEFLPCQLLGGTGYIFHCLNFKSISDDQVAYRTQNGMAYEVESLAFPGERDSIFMAQNAVTADLFCNESVVSAVKEARLTGLVFSENLARMVPA